MRSEITIDAMNMSCFFKRLKANLSKLIITNIFFAVPVFLYGTAIFLVCFFVLKEINIFLVGTIIIVASPLYAGVCRITKDLALDIYKSKNIFSLFIKTCKENILSFFLIGIVSYIFFILQWYAFHLYIDMTSVSAVFYFPLILSIIMCTVYLFLFFYIPTMIVTVNLKLKYIIKNGFMLVMLGIKRNFFLIGCFIFLFCLIAALTIFLYYPILSFIFLILVGLLIIFSLSSFLINFVSYVNIYSYIVQPFENKVKEEKRKVKEEAKKSLSNNENPDNLNTPDEYVFYNGRMIKKSVLAAQQEQLNKINNE